MKLPESFYFLRPAWWAVHVLAVGAVFAGGFVLAHHLAGHESHGSGHESHGSGHDHTSPEVLRPLMRQMLSDSVQLQGALDQGELERAAPYAESIAGACEDDGGGSHGELPARLGPSFLDHDRALHRSASQLGEALRSGQGQQARALNRKMVSECQSCHEQAPAASAVDLRALTTYSEGLTDGGEGAP